MAGKSLTLETLIHPKENTYFVILAVLSGLLWMALACLVVMWLPFVLLFGWLANGLFIARLRSESIEVTAEQMPELFSAFAETCERLGQRVMPRLYVLQSGGLLNAFATRFSARDFVVLYSDILEATGPESCEMRFILGHEIGHIRQKHLLKELFLMPGLFLPLIGNAYRRSRETTCDRYGMFAANDGRGAIDAMMMLVGGREAGRKFDPEIFAAQFTMERGFFVSWHEVLSSYPTLSRRVADLLALERGEPEIKPKRNPFAYILGFFSLSTPGGGIGSLVITLIFLFYIVMVGLPLGIGAIAASQKKLEEDGSSAFEDDFASGAVVEERVLEKGVIDERLVGEWKGDGEEYMWTTDRKADGSFSTRLIDPNDEPTEAGGQWRVLDGRYYEIFPDGVKDTYRVGTVTGDSVELSGVGDTSPGTFVEKRR